MPRSLLGGTRLRQPKKKYRSASPSLSRISSSAERVDIRVSIRT